MDSNGSHGSGSRWNVHPRLNFRYKKANAKRCAGVTGDFCPACAECVLNAVESNSVMNEMCAFSKFVNVAITDPGF
ncbi:type II toxin-antitoxin system MqsA family antitoxin [Pseudomonas sp. RTC3]|uniref:type II toxin-antitoxin system MqsA family antitoxin n=1 Tax=unclassified Pseudomonas TaxID=196821 RepID=UPI002B2327DE|nr:MULTISPECIES: type II toxin-antitoxin system MqsA family antitoxin [unclassified Pseudomonas]MEB0062028.1 type II toxin-antitoxin system MqsA family antitoxin [Pseudomonas sp. RTC3]MEB0149364.1 type II toxin-antitoxin system MqsA family antitoxin [Pseudomonas sp. CCC2.2]MEB0241532.1 type II toxin-antitoxin system MqsA family antitoxin [Pseudomonas sp. 5C2]MEE3507891.1 type II toxin-antitoxin system MqsA family antitoxin [Pseudomonas sp. 10C3]MEB0005410.1 type II toxin-antitoxin system MqsA 